MPSVRTIYFFDNICIMNTSNLPAQAPLRYIWSAQNAAGDNKRQTLTALVFMVTPLVGLLAVASIMMDDHRPSSLAENKAIYRDLFVMAAHLTMASTPHLRKRNAARGSVARNKKDLGLRTYLQEYDMRLESAAAEAALAHTLQGAVNGTCRGATDAQDHGFLFAD